MFQNSYQNGAYFQVLDPKTPQDKTKNLFKLTNTNANNKVFDKQLKTYIFEFNSPNSKISLPKQDRKQLCLIQQYLNLQIQLGSVSDWNIELSISDLTKTKRRIIISPSIHKVQKKPFFVKFPSTEVKEGLWTYLCIDMYSFIEAFKGQTYRCLDCLQIGGVFKLRRVFTSHHAFPEIYDQSTVSILPKQFYYPSEVSSQSVLISFMESIQSDSAVDQSFLTAKSGSRLKSAKSMKVQETKKFVKQEQQNLNSTQKTIEKGYKNEKKFLANTNGIQMKKRDMRQNSLSASREQNNSFKTIINTVKPDNNPKVRQSLNKTQNPQKQQKSIQKKNEKQIEKIKTKANPWRSVKKTSSISTYEIETKNNNKQQSKQFSMSKTGTRLNQKLEQSYQNNENSESAYFSRSQKFCTVTQTRFFQGLLSSNASNYQKQKSQNDEIEQDIELQSNQLHEKNEKASKRQTVKKQNNPTIFEEINDSLDQMATNKPNHQEFFNNTSHVGFAEKIVNRFMQQVERPYSPPLGERQQNNDNQEAEKNEKQVQVIYDPVLNCYYDHKTHTYYELKN